MEMEFSLQEIERIVQVLLPLVKEKSCICFEAEMGCGKTTLIRAICKQLYVVDTVTSPTFAIINEYNTYSNELQVIHMDWYRLKNAEEVEHTGALEYIGKKNTICLIEWSEIGKTLLPKDKMTIEIKYMDENTRKIIVH